MGLLQIRHSSLIFFLLRSIFFHCHKITRVVTKVAIVCFKFNTVLTVAHHWIYPEPIESSHTHSFFKINFNNIPPLYACFPRDLIPLAFPTELLHSFATFSFRIIFPLIFSFLICLSHKYFASIRMYKIPLYIISFNPHTSATTLHLDSSIFLVSCFSNGIDVLPSGREIEFQTQQNKRQNCIFVYVKHVLQ